MQIATEPFQQPLCQHRKRDRYSAHDGVVNWLLARGPAYVWEPIRFHRRPDRSNKVKPDISDGEAAQPRAVSEEQLAVCIKFIILNANFIIFDTSFIIFDTQLITFNAHRYHGVRDGVGYEQREGFAVRL